MFNHLHEYPLGVHIVSFAKYCLVFMVKYSQKFRKTNTVNSGWGHCIATWVQTQC